MTDLHTSISSGPTDQLLMNETIGKCFRTTAAAYPDHDGLIVRHQGVSWTYAEYLQRVDELAAGLLALGIKPGDRVGIWAPNCYEWCLTQYATASIGAIMVCINPAYRVYELEYALNKVQCRALITAERFKTSDYLGILRELAPEIDHCQPGALQLEKLPHLDIVVRMGEETSAGMYNFGDVCQLGEQAHYDQLAELGQGLDPDSPINIQFTSGTTGNPKGATLTHNNILNNGKLVGDGMKLTATDRLCIPVPLYHCFGMVMGNLACITHGSAAVFPGEGFDPEATLLTVAEEKCTALHGVPTMFIAELDAPGFEDYDLSSLRTGIMAGATCPVEVMRNVLDHMHMSDVLIAYGQTETSPVNHMTATDDPIEKRVGTVGRTAPHVEVKITDESGETLPIGERGEICVRGYSVMDGYWDDEQRTTETIDSEKWLHSGDIGIMDAEGYVQVVGRIKDMIIRGGENVYPREVEEFLYTHPAILEAQVFGIPHEKYGEEVCAWIQLQDGENLSEEELRSFCKDRITHFKIPSQVRFVSEFPMTVTGKIQKFLMRDDMASSLGR